MYIYVYICIYIIIFIIYTYKSVIDMGVINNKGASYKEEAGGTTPLLSWPQAPPLLSTTPFEPTLLITFTQFLTYVTPHPRLLVLFRSLPWL